MQHKKKSNSIDYEFIYRVTAITCICFFSYILLSFFLLMSDALSVFLLFGSIFLLGAHLFTKEKLYLTLSFVSCSLSILSTIIFYFI